MFEFGDNLLKALSAYPPLAAIAALAILGFGMWLLARGERDRKNAGLPPVPPWLQYGPGAEAILYIKKTSEMNVEHGKTLEHSHDCLQDIREVLKDILTESRNNKAILEAIRNESRLR